MAFDPELQGQLDDIWFRLPTDTPSGQREERQRMLVREFQIAARGRYGAQDLQTGGTIDADRLRQVDIREVSAAAGLPSTLLPSGDADQTTRNAIAAWHANRLRAPVVFQAISPGDPKAPWKAVVAQGFCFHDELTNTKPRVFAVDFTDRQNLVNGKPPKVPVGTAILRTIKHKKAPPTYQFGSVSTVAHSLTPFDADHVVGVSWSELKEKESTFRVLKALAHVEAGVFDGINAWDSSVLSAGPYHYTAFSAGGVDASEFGAFLAYVANAWPSEFNKYFLDFGVNPQKVWGAALFDKSDRTYRAKLGFVDAGGAYLSPTVGGRDWLRTWHSFYRIQHAFRNSPGLMGAVWPFARQRIRDLLDTPFTTGAPPGASKLKDVFRSERTVALLLRWHVFRPHHIVDDGTAGLVPAMLVKNAGLSNKDVTKWTLKEEKALAGSFLQKGGTALAGKQAVTLLASLGVVDALRDTTAPKASNLPLLRLDRNFSLYADGIPFPDPGPSMRRQTSTMLARGRATPRERGTKV